MIRVFTGRGGGYGTFTDPDGRPWPNGHGRNALTPSLPVTSFNTARVITNRQQCGPASKGPQVYSTGGTRDVEVRIILPLLQRHVKAEERIAGSGPSSNAIHTLDINSGDVNRRHIRKPFQDDKEIT